jgi:hypothetical protein
VDRGPARQKEEEEGPSGWVGARLDRRWKRKGVPVYTLGGRNEGNICPYM